eukprot:TRINITY_DN4570_c0_g1_i1.p1 TRINITY_DN4570_c0_g1~~TRINITY_DN4570_c0_g1_i1.p1  ORF type:complete len:444 (-),score=65.79 TRINITY_DN4570_c0_g1_i1:614-1945(-)
MSSSRTRPSGLALVALALLLSLGVQLTACTKVLSVEESQRRSTRLRISVVADDQSDNGSQFDEQTFQSGRRSLHGGVVHEGAAAPTEATVSLHSAPLIRSKGGAIAVFFLVPFIGVLIPVFLPINAEILKYCLLFASGLFFTLALEHLTSDSASGFADLVPDSVYPYAYLLVAGGYMVTWFFDLVAHAVWDRKAEQNFVNPKEDRWEQDKETQRLVCCQSPAEAPLDSGEKCTGVGCNCNGDTCRCKASGLEFTEHQEVLRTGDAIARAVGRSKVSTETNLGVAELGAVDLLLLVLALCFHAVFEGLAIGLSTTVFDVWNTTLTIVLHKLFEGVALGSALLAQEKSKSLLAIALYAFFFCIMGPVGIAIGIALDSSDDPVTSQWVEALGNGFAAGVFIFVAVSHLMVKGFRKGEKDRWWTPFLKWFACGLGLITVSLLELRSS